jgi:hypothetical protein
LGLLESHYEYGLHKPWTFVINNAELLQEKEEMLMKNIVFEI